MQALLLRGISRELAASVLDDAGIDESEQIRKELTKRGYSPDMDDHEKQKIFAALARKGYSWNQISENIR